MSKFKFHKNSTYKSRIKKWVIENSFRFHEWKESGEDIYALNLIEREFEREVLNYFSNEMDYKCKQKIKTSLNNIIMLIVTRDDIIIDVLSKSDFE